MPEQAARDWTTGRAKWGAVVFLGVLCAAGLGRSIITGSSRSPSMRASVVESSARTAGSALESKPATPAPDSAKPEDPQKPPTDGRIVTLININTATQTELELLPGIGPAIAKRIIDDRAANGAYKSVDDLDRVKGIGPRIIQRLREKVSVE